MGYKKIAIVGISGSGKSTLARYLSTKTGLPVFHVDTLLWKEHWESAPADEYLREHASLIKKKEWIIEGYVDKEMSGRLQEADLVLYLDYQGILCGWRVMDRWWKYRNKNRPEFSKETVETFDLKFLVRVLIRAERRDIEEAIEAGKPIHLKKVYSAKELEHFIRDELVR